MNKNSRSYRPFAKVWERVHGQKLDLNSYGQAHKNPETRGPGGKHYCCNRWLKNDADRRHHREQFHREERP